MRLIERLHDRQSAPRPGIVVILFRSGCGVAFIVLWSLSSASYAAKSGPAKKDSGTEEWS